MNCVIKEGKGMPKITLKETITKEIDIPIETLCELIDHLSPEDRNKMLMRLQSPSIQLKPFHKDKIASILSDFQTTGLYENRFLKDLEEGLKKSSPYR
jgi:hypothetical protein